MSDGLARLRVPEGEEWFDQPCRSCGGDRVELVIDLSDQPHCNRLVAPDLPLGTEPSYPLRLGFCHDCTLAQIDHTIPKESMFSDYPYVSGTTKTLPLHFRETVDRLERAYALGKGDLVVDIGSNDGTWLKQYGHLGCRVLGVEAAANVAGIAREAGIPTWQRFFDEACADEIRAEHGAARLITAAGVFFHLEELHSVVRGIKRLLDEDGVFVVQAIYLGGMIENTAFDQIYHEHLCYYTLRSLSQLVGRHGLEVVEASLVPIHGGSIEAHIVHQGRRPVGESVKRLAEAERSAGLDDIATYRRFADRVLALRDRLTAILENEAGSGRKIWAYGAPAKGSTLLNSFGIGPSLVERAVEKNPMKVGLAIPGVRIPITAEDEGRPDAYLVLAWNFIDEFLAKEADYLSAGGTFIVPIPDVRRIVAETVPA
ncbi:MAG: class I SAM-dependent methyltransferase [Geminicoccaceae bacterium]